MKLPILLLGFIFLVYSSFAQQQLPEEDIKVGLVLSGGGAKGLAHIGALKAIEESGVQIDYIAGTSMGAIVGALYASGYSAEELTAIFEQVDFEELIRDDFSRKNKSFFERSDADKHSVTLPFNKFKLSFPSAISKGQNVYNYYVQLLNHVKEVDDFSRLPIPFFCIATNAETGKQVILDKGYLPDAMAASGAIPTLFDPVMLNGNLLIDGGVSNNYPINELLEKDVDVVIGVDVQDNLRPKEELKSASEIMLQISNFNTQNQMQEKVEKTAVYIKPDISNYNIVSFQKGKEIYSAGYNAAILSKDSLSAISKKQKVKYTPIISKRLPEAYQLKDIVIKGNESYTDAYILGKLKIKTPSTVSHKKITKGIISLAATNNFHTVKHKVKHDSILELNIQEVKNKTSLKFALHYDNLYKSLALVNITHKQLFTNNDIASLDVILGEDIRYNFEYYIDKGFYWSLGVKSSLNSFSKNVSLSIFDNNVPSLITQVDNIEVFDVTSQFYVETLFRKDFSLALGAEHKLLKITADNSGVKYENNNFYSAFGTLKYDSLDDKYYPTKGVYFNGDFHLYFLSSEEEVEDYKQFSIAKAKMGFATPIFKEVYLNLFTEGGFRVGNNTTPSLDFVLGGYGNDFLNNYKPFYGYDFLSLAGDGYVKADIDIHYQFYKKHFLSLSANIANIDDGLFKDSDWLSTPDYIGYALGYGTKTLLGPMQIKSTWSPDVKKVQWFVSLGYWF